LVRQTVGWCFPAGNRHTTNFFHTNKNRTAVCKISGKQASTQQVTLQITMHIMHVFATYKDLDLSYACLHKIEIKIFITFEI